MRNGRGMKMGKKLGIGGGDGGARVCSTFHLDRDEEKHQGIELALLLFRVQGEKRMKEWNERGGEEGWDFSAMPNFPRRFSKTDATLSL